MSITNKKVVSIILCVMFPFACFSAQSFSENFSRFEDSGWGSSEYGVSWQINTIDRSRFSVNSSEGVISLSGSSGSYEAYVRSIGESVEITSSIYFSSIPSSSYVHGGLISRSTNNSFYYARIKNSNSRVNISIQKVISGSQETLISKTLPLIFKEYQKFNIRFMTLGVNPTMLYAKVWPDNELEPTPWSLTVVDDEPVLQSEGGIGVRAGTGSSYAGNSSFFVDNIAMSICVKGDRVCGLGAIWSTGLGTPACTVCYQTCGNEFPNIVGKFTTNRFEGLGSFCSGNIDAAGGSYDIGICCR